MNTKRPPRRIPTLYAIASYWHGRETSPFDPFDLDEPACFACKKAAELREDGNRQKRWNRARLDRAHLIDRARGGLDGEQNLVPLCRDCHKSMPSFTAGDERYVIDWVRFGVEPPPRTDPVLEARIAEIVAAAPPLSNQQRAVLARILGAHVRPPEKAATSAA